MDLELKILKEKVKEDEADSGIGGLFDDEKTSHEHISLLKSKYSAMRRESDKKFELLDKDKLETMGEKFMFEAQLQTNRDQLKKMKTGHSTWFEEHNKSKFEEEKSVKNG